LSSDLLHPVSTEPLGHRLDRWLAASVHTDWCQAQRPAMSIDWDHGLSLAAEGDRSYRIASICGLCSDRADQ
jgi:hypothetical protein